MRARGISRVAVVRLLALVLGVAALAVLATRFPLRAVPEAVAQLGPVGPVAGVVVFAGLLVALVPRTPISVACGLIFGPALGPACAIAVMMVAAAATFTLGRTLGRGFLLDRLGASQDAGDHRTRGPAARLRRWWTGIERWITREGMLAVAAVRSWPLGPYGLVGYVYGTSAVRVRDYALGTLLAGTPSAVLYALLGAAAGGSGTHPAVFALLPFGLALTIVVAWRTRASLRADALGEPSR